MGGKAITFEIALAPKTGNVCADIHHHTYHQETWSRLAKESRIPTEPPV